MCWSRGFPLVCTLLTLSALPHSSATITDNFRSWLNSNGFSQWDFARDEIVNGSYGGKSSDSDIVINQPVVYVHGNLATGSEWDDNIEYMLGKGYTTAELYATTWTSDHEVWSDQTLDESCVMINRKFFEAVMEYTGAQYIDIIAHSQGVVLSRKALKGGGGIDDNGTISYQVGEPLSASVDTFVGIAGPNLGMMTCTKRWNVNSLHCNQNNGMYPGLLDDTGAVVNRSKYLVDLAENPGYEGQYRYALWSTHDEIIGNKIYGEHNAWIPEQTGEKGYSNATIGHIDLPFRTMDEQLQLITQHAL